MYRSLLLFLSVALLSCNGGGSGEEVYTPVPVSLDIPQLFQQQILAPIIPSNNPLTEEGIALGKRLFFDRRLSKDNSKSCASCHNPGRAFTDNTVFSVGVEGQTGVRNSMPLFNLAWNYSDRFAWDGKELGLERQALEPVTNPIEMHSTWVQVAEKFQQDSQYPDMFFRAFGSSDIDSTKITKAIAQFERTLISGNSKFDQFQLGNVDLTPQEANGFDVYLREDKGDCFHCHGTGNNPLWTDNAFHNNGLDAVFTDLGLGAVTGDPNDNAKFRTPSLRNLAFTAPYMHDGRFATLEEVIDFYSEGLQNSPTIDPLMKNVGQGGVQLSPSDKSDLVAFLLTLTDNEFVTNPAFQNN